MLSRIKLSFVDIRNALLELDDDKLHLDNLKAISKQLPTVEEVCLPFRGFAIILTSYRSVEFKISMMSANLPKQINIFIRWAVPSILPT
jgi:hypothetical protein